MNFYLTIAKDGKVGFSPLREEACLNSAFSSRLRAPLPCSVVLAVQERLARRKAVVFWPLRAGEQDPKRQIVSMLKEFGWRESDLIWQECTPEAEDGLSLPEEPNEEIVKAFQRLTWGRQLSSKDLRGLARELKVKEDDVIRLAHSQVEQGWAQWVPAVRAVNGGWQCQRCGEKDVEEWPGQHGMAATCKSCASIGAGTSLDVLYRDERFFPTGFAGEESFQPHWMLTEAQSLASEQVLEFIKSPEQKAALLWAACGAGKTEVCFPAAAWALAEGKSILFAAPRRDVIQDVAPRLQRDFPHCQVQVLTGTASVKYQTGRMVLATTHQILRFWRAFEVIFLDEMDAFPYQGNRALAWGVSHALRQGGKILYLTATPSPEALKAVQRGRMGLIRLPARHHRHPLPVPIWEKVRHMPEASGPINAWLAQIGNLRVRGPVLVFVPKIAWVEPWNAYFRLCFPGWRIDGSYSSDPGRASKMAALRSGEFDLFVSTTILERGITLPGIQVVVLGADHPIFDERALVQMAGRAGRTREQPTGEVMYIAVRMTPAMRTAIRWIKEQNKLARELGLTD